MCFDSSSTTNSTSTFTPPPQVSAAGNQALSQAQSLGNAPFQIPTQPIANFTPQQLQAFQNINNTQGMAQPYFNAGATFQTPFGASQYFLPEAQGVTNELNNLYAQQMASVTGNLTQAAGGVGADRIAVGQSELANQQGLAEGQTLAQLYNNAVGQAQQAGVNLGNLGQGASNTALSEAAAQLGAGTQQQQLSQQDLNAVYKNILQQITWPYQTTQYLGALEAGVAPSLGGTTTGTSTTTSSPSVFSDIGSVFSILKRGGKVEGYDEGGSVPSDLGDLQAISSQLSAYISQRQQNQPSAPTAPNLGAPSQPTQVPSQGQGSTFGGSPSNSGFAALTGQQGGVSIPTLGGSIFGGNGNTGSTSQFTNAPFKGFFGFGRGGAPRHYDSGGPTQSNPNPYAAPAALAAYASPGAGSSGAALPTEDISQTMPQGLMGQLQQLNAERAALVNPLAPAAAPSSNGKGSFFGLGSLFAPASGFNLAQFGQPPTNANLTGNNVISPPHDTIGGFDGFGGLNFDQGGTVPSMDVPGVSDNEALMNLLGLQNLGAGGILSQTGQIHSPWASGAQRVAPAPNSGKPPTSGGQGQNAGQQINRGFKDLNQGFNQGLDGSGSDSAIDQSTGDLTDMSTGDVIPGARGGVMNPFRTAHHFDDGGDVGGDDAGSDIPTTDPAPVDLSLPDRPQQTLNPAIAAAFNRHNAPPRPIVDDVAPTQFDFPAVQAFDDDGRQIKDSNKQPFTVTAVAPTGQNIQTPVSSPFGSGATPVTGPFPGMAASDVPAPAAVQPTNPMAAPAPTAPAPATSGSQPRTMKGSWFGDYSGDNTWSDPKGASVPTASGIPTSTQGIALPTPIKKGQMYRVTAPNGQSIVVPQIDVGPAARTGRGVDISAAAAEGLGYSPKNFPTDGNFKVEPIGNEPNSFLSSRGKNLITDNMNPTFTDRLQRLTEAAEKATGKRAQINDLYRSPETQAQYYANYTQRPVTYAGKVYQPGAPGGLAAPPGSSYHQAGAAADIQSGPVRDWMREHANEYGLHFLNDSRDLGHVQLTSALAPPGSSRPPTVEGSVEGRKVSSSEPSIFDKINPFKPSNAQEGPDRGPAYNAGKSLIGGPLGAVNQFLEGTGIGQGKSALSRLGRAMLNPFAEPKYQLQSTQAEMAKMEVGALRSALGPGNDPKSSAESLLNEVPSARRAVADEHTPAGGDTSAPLPRGQAPAAPGTASPGKAPESPVDQFTGSPAPQGVVDLQNRIDGFRRQALEMRARSEPFLQPGVGALIGARAKPYQDAASGYENQANALETRLQSIIGPGNMVQNGRVVPVATPLKVEEARQTEAAKEGEKPIDVPGYGSIPHRQYQEALTANPDNPVQYLRDHFGTAKPQETSTAAPPAQPYPAGPRLTPVKPQASDYHPYTYDKEGVELEKESTKKLGDKLATGVDDGQKGLKELKTLQADVARLGDKGFLQTGAGDKARADFAKKFNAFNSIYLGGSLPDIDKTQIASAQDAEKITNRAGFLLSRSLGAREAAVVTQTAIASVPGIENTREGNALINSSLEEDIQYNKDKYDAFQQWRHLSGNRGWDTHDFEEWFAKSHPPEMYVARAQLKAGMPVLVDSPKAAGNLPEGSKIVTPDGSIGVVPSQVGSDWSGFNLKPVDANDAGGAYWAARIGYTAYSGAGWIKGLVSKLGGMLGPAGEGAGIALGHDITNKVTGHKRGGQVKQVKPARRNDYSDATKRALRYARSMR